MQKILDKFNIQATSHIDCNGSIFDGCADEYKGSYKGYDYYSKWVGVNDRESTITSPSGVLVAHCHSMFHNGMWWVDEKQCPKFLFPLGEEYRQEEKRQEEKRQEELEAQEQRRIDQLKLDRIKRSYRGTRLFAHLDKIGLGSLKYLVR